MKQIYFLILIVAFGLTSCSKSGNPTPDAPPPTQPTQPTETLAITDFSPKTADIGATITITGIAFGTDTNAVAIKFGTSASRKPKTITATQLTAIVPKDAVTGKIQVTIGNNTATSNDALTINPAKPSAITITSFSPKNVTTGDTLKITGTNFGTDASKVLIYLNIPNDTGTKPLIVTSTQITVIIPSTAKSGKVRVVVQNGGDVTSADSFTYLTPTDVNQISPSSARAGELITINGNYYKTDDLKSISVLFTGSSTTVNPLSLDDHNNILVRVPSDAKTGKIKVTKGGFGTGTSAATFTVLSPLPTVLSGTWTSRPDFPSSGRAGAIAFTIGTKAYIGCGTTNAPFDGFGQSDMWQYDQTYNAWMQVASFAGGARVSAVAFAINGKGYLGTGLNGSAAPTTDFWEYDPDTNSWAQKADFKGFARAYGVGFTIGNNGYVGSGRSGANSTGFNDFYQYTPSNNTWTQITSIPGNRSDAFAFVADNKGYVGGGRNASTPISDLYMYDPSANTWTAKANIAGYDYTSGNSSFTIGSKGYVGLGYKLTNGVQTVTNQAFEYTPSSNSWKALPNYGGVARSSAVGFAISNIGYFGLGQPNAGTSVYKDFWAYTP
jgi:N-acetylneuraminic acid mutarotase